MTPTVWTWWGFQRFNGFGFASQGWVLQVLDSHCTSVGGILRIVKGQASPGCERDSRACFEERKISIERTRKRSSEIHSRLLLQNVPIALRSNVLIQETHLHSLLTQNHTDVQFCINRNQQTEIDHGTVQYNLAS